MLGNRKKEPKFGVPRMPVFLDRSRNLRRAHFSFRRAKADELDEEYVAYRSLLQVLASTFDFDLRDAGHCVNYVDNGGANIMGVANQACYSRSRIFVAGDYSQAATEHKLAALYFSSNSVSLRERDSLNNLCSHAPSTAQELSREEISLSDRDATVIPTPLQGFANTLQKISPHRSWLL
jgi:hypothetical protein